jgi:hypothetical protein
MAALSSSWSYTYFGWMHSDGVVLKKDAHEDVSALVAEQLGKMSAWGVFFTKYDILAFYNTQVSLVCSRLDAKRMDCPYFFSVYQLGTVCALLSLCCAQGGFCSWFVIGHSTPLLSLVHRGGAVEELYGTRYQSGSFSLINVGSGFRCLRSVFFFHRGLLLGGDPKDTSSYTIAKPLPLYRCYTLYTE